MDPDERDTLDDTGTDTVEPQDDDNVDLSAEFAPEDDQDTEESQDEEATDDGGEEPEADEEAEEAIFVEINGEKKTVDELKKGYLRQEDYSRKTQDVAQQRQALEADLRRMESITEAFVEKLSAYVPPEPDAALAAKNPALYVQQMAAHNQAMKAVTDLIELGGQTKEVSSGLTEAELKNQVAAENALLAAKFPETAKEGGRQKFFAGAASAAEAVGFTMDDLNGTTDHRLFALAHYAKIGMDAMKAKAPAQAKVSAAPPPKQVTGGNRNAEAMKRLNRTGSLRDAAKVDFI